MGNVGLVIGQGILNAVYGKEFGQIYYEWDLSGAMWCLVCTETECEGVRGGLVMRGSTV